VRSVENINNRAEAIFNMTERPPIERVGPGGEDKGPTPKPPGGAGGITG
jgi:hypothetical protein